MLANMGATRNCVCGCRREVPRRLIPVNLLAFEVMTELVAFDGMRALMVGASRQSETDWDSGTVDQFVDDGADCYRALIDVLHEDTNRWDRAGTKRWLKFARKSRKKLARQGIPISSEKAPVKLTDEDLAYLIRDAPETSYSRAITADGSLLGPDVAPIYPAGDVSARDQSERDFDSHPEDLGELGNDEVLECPDCGRKFAARNDYLHHYRAKHR
jgi:hypothetical protein